MMPVQVKCPNPQCHKVLNIGEQHGNQAVRCPHCNKTFRVSVPGGTSSELASRADASMTVDERAAQALAANASRTQSLVDAPSAMRATASSPALRVGAPSQQAPQKIGRFVIRNRLGAGAFGTVYRAYDPQLDREVALKVPQPGSLDTPRHVERFLREAKAAAQLRHPHIVPVHDAGRDGEHHYIASAFIQGRTLALAIEEGKLDFRKSAKAVHDLAEALAYAHGLGIVHRDVKPANVMVDEQGQCHLMDFGLAHRHDSAERLTQDGTVLGTPAYMAPEQAVGQRGEPQPASDQYSLGVVLYEMLAGHTPFSGPPQIVIFNHIQKEPPPLRSVKRRIPQDLETICLKALSKKPHERYASCQELANDLRRWLEGEPIRARPMGPFERTLRWCLNHKALVSTGAAITVTALTVLIATALLKSAAADHAREKQRAEEMDRLRSVAEEQRVRAEYQESLGRRNVYVSRIRDAARAWEEPNILRMDELLEETRPANVGGQNFRHFEWHYLARVRQSNQLLTLKGHKHWISSVAYSPDGKRIASGGGEQYIPAVEPGEINVWDAATGRLIFPLKGHTMAVKTIAFSPDGNRLASAAWDNTVKLWDLNQGKEITTLRGHGHWVNCVGFTPDGKHVASGSYDRTIKVWDASSGQELATLRGHSGIITALACHPDSKRVASATGDYITEKAGGEIKIWDITEKKEVLALPNQGGPVYSLTFGPEGKLFVACPEGILKVWDVNTGQETADLKVHEQFGKVVCSRDGQRLATASAAIKVWNRADRKLLVTLRGHKSGGAAIDLHPSENRLVSGSTDGLVKVWDISKNQEFTSIPGGTRLLSSLDFSPDGGLLAVSSHDALIRVWDWSKGQEKRKLQGHTREVTKVVFSPDGKLLGSSSNDGTVKLWNAESGAPIATFGPVGRAMISVAFSPDGRLVAGAAQNSTVVIWDISSRALVATLKGHTDIANSVAFTPDSKTVATASSDKTIRIWDVRTQKELHTLAAHGNLIWNITFSADGKQLASCSVDNTVKLWNPQTGELIHTLKGHKGTVYGVRFHPDGSRLASSSYDRTIRLWDTLTGQEVLMLKGHTDSVRDVAFTPDGKVLASVSSDGTIKTWDGAPTE